MVQVVFNFNIHLCPLHSRHLRVTGIDESLEGVLGGTFSKCFVGLYFCLQWSITRQRNRMLYIFGGVSLIILIDIQKIMEFVGFYVGFFFFKETFKQFPERFRVWTFWSVGEKEYLHRQMMKVAKFLSNICKAHVWLKSPWTRLYKVIFFYITCFMFSINC